MGRCGFLLLNQQHTKSGAFVISIRLTTLGLQARLIFEAKATPLVARFIMTRYSAAFKAKS